MLSPPFKKYYNVTSLAEVWIEILKSALDEHSPSVTSLAEVWIEIQGNTDGCKNFYVTSLAEVWIEIELNSSTRSGVASLPLRKCGLKCADLRCGQI